MKKKIKWKTEITSIWLTSSVFLDGQEELWQFCMRNFVHRQQQHANTEQTNRHCLFIFLFYFHIEVCACVYAQIMMMMATAMYIPYSIYLFIKWFIHFAIETGFLFFSFSPHSFPHRVVSFSSLCLLLLLLQMCAILMPTKLTLFEFNWHKQIRREKKEHIWV